MSDEKQEPRQKSRKTQKPNLWKAGDPYQFPIPRPKGDLYEKLLAPFLQRDINQCKAWTDEVQNLLIFAGLFSAVVTAFVIESYKCLQPDPNAVVVLLLARIADRLDHPLNSSVAFSTVNPTLPTFTSTQTSVRINIFWFISLVLSLTTVLIGIISLQWLREHQHYDVALSSREKFAIFNMRAKGLKRWYGPQIFSALPLLLQVALVLFLIGIADFLLVLEDSVAIPVIIVIGLPITFLFVTTTFPTFQVYTLYLPILLQVNNKVPSQCPYKSPQSYLFRRLATFTEVPFRAYALAFSAVYLPIFAFPRHFLNWLSSFRSLDIKTTLPIFVQTGKYLWKNSLEKSSSLPLSEPCSGRETPPSLRLLRAVKSTNWTDYDLRWTEIRTRYSRLLLAPSKPVSLDYENQPIYDIVHGLRSIVREHTQEDEVQSVYHCIHDLSLTEASRNIAADIMQEQHHYLRVLFESIYELRSSGVKSDRRNSHRQATSLPLPFTKITTRAIHEESIYRYFLAMRNYYNGSKLWSLTMENHQNELWFRLVTPSLVTEEETVFNKSWQSTWDYFDWHYRSHSMLQNAAWQNAICDQWPILLESFFIVIIPQIIPVDDDLSENDYDAGIASLSNMLLMLASHQKSNDIESTLSLISARLRHFLYNHVGLKPDYLFLAASFYIRSLRALGRSKDGFYMSSSAFGALADLLPIMRTYMDISGIDNVDWHISTDVEGRPARCWENLLLRHIPSDIFDDISLETLPSSCFGDNESRDTTLVVDESEEVGFKSSRNTRQTDSRSTSTSSLIITRNI